MIKIILSALTHANDSYFTRDAAAIALIPTNYNLRLSKTAEAVREDREEILKGDILVEICYMS